jgi:hypothetical protein
VSEIKAQLRAYLEATPEVTFDEIMAAAALDREDAAEMVRPRPQQPARWRGPLVAAGTAVAIVVVVAALLLVLRGGSIGVSDTPVTETSDAVIPPAMTVPTTATTVPRAAGAGGAITIVVTDLTDAVGNDLSGVLMSYEANAPESYKWDGVAGLATTVDADPFWTSQALGEVTDGWAEDPSDGLWPWPTGTASVPAGDYSLWLWTGKDYCCYSRWAPAASPGLRGCELRVSTTGRDQTIYVKDIPLDGGPCTTDPATATTGTITIEMDAVPGIEGYRLFAGVWSESADPPLVGGAFWMIIDRDTFSGSDFVHPPIYPNPDTEASDVEGWAADDYLWNSVAQLEPGPYRIDVWANPGELAPYGSHIPASPIERTCTVDVDVAVGENTPVVITGVTTDGEPCETATESGS